MHADTGNNGAHWLAATRQFALQHLPPVPARVLEIGCGNGELALAVADLGYDVVAIDPNAPSGPIFQQVTIEALNDPGLFDAVLSSLALHHVHDLGLVLDKCAHLLPSGPLIVVEYAHERVDDATARWYMANLRATAHEHSASSHEHSGGFLVRRYEEWRGAAESGSTTSFGRWYRDWSEQNGMHLGQTILRELRARFDETFLEWGPYLYSDLPVTARDEAAAIERGVIQATSFRFVGRPRTQRMI